MPFISKYNVKKIFFTSVLVSIPFINIDDIGKAETIEQPISVSESFTTHPIKLLVANTTIYDDFNPNEYWADNMLWMINKGYITGYIKQKHPTTGKYGTWLNPYGNLTESQMLSVLLRYKLGLQGYDALMANTSAPANFWSFPLYQKAQQLGIVTKGSTSNKNYQSTQVTRGQLAQALVSMHYGKSVTLEEAVQFMFDNNITTGTNPAKGATMENFAPNTKLARAHIASFLKRYDDVVKQGNIKDLPRFKNGNNTNSGGTPTSPNPTETQYETHPNTIGKDPNIYTLKIKKGNSPDVVGSKIKTKFGERAYGARTQEEYDKTMEIVEKEFKDGKYDLSKYGRISDLQQKAREDFFIHGKTAIKDKMHPEYRTQYNQTLLGTEIMYGVFKDKIKTIDEVNTLTAITQLFGRIGLYINHDAYQNANYGYDPVSAYDLLVKGLWDCTSGSYYITAMLDQVGIDSFVLHSPGRVHAYIVINVYGDWYVKDDGPGGTEGYVKMSPEFLRPHDAILEAPNVGIDALPKFLQDIYRPSN
ncbi:hypothetical protein [Ureibacillus thermosphaericus]|uniref:hypothetical protein n=1 Tax=Ureibacillus thermosphaericus TaxID=51173 RepID=UPI000BBBA1AE|nr:hypothetical protein [Ureibacillus thermosphaericus]